MFGKLFSEIKCEKPVLPLNGTISYSATDARPNHGQIATYTCSKGYYLVGNHQRQCIEVGFKSTNGVTIPLSDVGIWNGTDPFCKGNSGTMEFL